LAAPGRRRLLLFLFVYARKHVMGRRGNGEGSIFKRKDGRFEARIFIDGKRRSKCAKTQRELQRWLTEARKARDSGLPLIDSHQTLEGFLASWLPGRQNQLRHGTWSHQEWLIRRYILPSIGKVPVSQLRPQHVQLMQDRMLELGLSPSSAHHAHAVLHRALQDAVRWDLAARNVAALVAPPRMARREMKTLTKVQVQTFLAAAAEDRLNALWVLAATTGMREGEMVGLYWAEVDLERRQLRVNATLRWTRGSEPVVNPPKTPRSRRQISLSQAAVAALRHHKALQAGERLRAGPEWPESDFVFTDEQGGPLYAHKLLYRFWKLLARAGLPRIRFHDLRHTAASLLLAENVHPKIVSDLLGHASVSITLDVYSHAVPALQAEVVRVMDEIAMPGRAAIPS